MRQFDEAQTHINGDRRGTWVGAVVNAKGAWVGAVAGARGTWVGAVAEVNGLRAGHQVRTPLGLHTSARGAIM